MSRVSKMQAVGNYIILDTESCKSDLVHMSPGGIEIPTHKREEANPNRAIIMAIGSLVDREKAGISIGDKIIFRSGSGDGRLPAIRVDGIDYAVCYPDNIIAIEEKAS